MKIHPLMLVAAIAFWGWQTGQWGVAGAVAANLCASFYLDMRWEIGTARLRRVADACLALALLMGGYFYATVVNPGGLILFFQWLPVAYVPLAIAHAYGTAERMDQSVLFWSLRRRPAAKPETFDPWFPYYAAWIVAASAANGRSEWFYVALVALVAWPLLRLRPRAYQPALWAAVLLTAIGLGYGLQYQLHATQSYLEEAVPDWIAGDGSLTDPYRSSTHMGSIGKLKESDAIVLRIVTADDAEPPRLFHQASFNSYFDKAWLAGHAGFANIARAGDQRWPLAENGAPISRVTVYDYTASQNPVISLPGGTSAIRAPRLVSAQRNRLGTVQVVRKPGFFSYVAEYSGDAVFEEPPTDEDLKLPTGERELLEKFAAQLRLVAATPAQRVARVESFFADGFTYTTYLEQAPTGTSPVANFLMNTKSGHCEYFATATALLLRAGGVPTRYATGFAVHEHSELEDAYVARLRHRHAWVRAFVNGAWIEIDTTPPSWLAIEAEDSGMWSTVKDWWSWLRFRLAQAWENSDERQLIAGAAILVLPLLLWLGWRLYRSRRKSIVVANKSRVSHAIVGSDSDFYRIEQRLSQLGQGRRPQDSTHDWLTRIGADPRIDTTTLAGIVELHHRYRFDPIGLTDAQRASLTESVDRWLAKLAKTMDAERVK